MSIEYIGYMIAGIIILIAIIVAIVAQSKVNSTYKEYSDVPAKSGITGRQLAEMILNGTGNKATLRGIRGNLTDNYNPVNKTVNISEVNINSSSIAGLGVVAHEMGHYLQHQSNYAPFKARQIIIKISNFVSGMFLPLLIIGLILNIVFAATTGFAGNFIIWLAVGMYGISTVANLATLSVEKDASRRALKMLQGMNILDEVETAQTKKVLDAAALTYVAALLVSLGYFLRFLFYALMITRRD